MGGGNTTANGFKNTTAYDRKTPSNNNNINPNVV